MTAPIQQQPAPQADGESATMVTTVAPQPAGDVSEGDTLAYFTDLPDMPARTPTQPALPDKVNYSARLALDLDQVTLDGLTLDAVKADGRLAWAWQVQLCQREHATRAATIVGDVNANANLSPQGRLDEFTKREAVPTLKRLDEIEKKTTALARQGAEQARALTLDAKLPILNDAERVEFVAAGQGLRREAEARFPDSIAKQQNWIQDEVMRDPETAALVANVSHRITGASRAVRELAQARVRPDLTRETRAEVERHEYIAKMNAAGAMRAGKLKRHILAGSHRPVLEEAGVVPPSIRRLSTAERAKLAAEVGHEEYRRLWAQG